jgi:aspartate carbamoyltransferase catalytic subunit
MEVGMKHFISIQSIPRESIDKLLDRAEQIARHRPTGRPLSEKILGLLFFEPSTRTRMSFESSMLRLGGQCLNLGGAESSVMKGETLADTIRVVDGYVDAIVLRHPRIGAAQLSTEFSSVPIINAGDGAGQHPSQTLIDLYTIRQSFPLDGLDVGLLGDLHYGRTTHSLAYALAKYGVTIHTISPKGLGFPLSVKRSLTRFGACVVEHESIKEALPHLDVLYVTRIQRERFPDPASHYDTLHSYRITPELLSNAQKHLIVLHPLPRIDEIDPGVDVLPHAKYFEQAKNGIPVRMALLLGVMK